MTQTKIKNNQLIDIDNAAKLGGLSIADMFTNMGKDYTTINDFNNITDPGFYFISGNTNGPPNPGATFFYALAVGGSKDFPFSYNGAVFAMPAFPYGGTSQIYVRLKYASTWQPWQAIIAATATTVGFWTPTVAFGGNAVGLTYAAGYTSGVYIRTGYIVQVYCYCALSNKGSSVGPLQLGGLPFNIYTQSIAYYSSPILRVTGVPYSGTLAGYGEFNTHHVVVQDILHTGVVQDIDTATIANNMDYILNFNYITTD